MFEAVSHPAAIFFAPIPNALSTTDRSKVIAIFIANSRGQSKGSMRHAFPPEKLKADPETASDDRKTDSGQRAVAAEAAPTCRDAGFDMPPFEHDIVEKR